MHKLCQLRQKIVTFEKIVEENNMRVNVRNGFKYCIQYMDANWCFPCVIFTIVDFKVIWLLLCISERSFFCNQYNLCKCMKRLYSYSEWRQTCHDKVPSHSGVELIISSYIIHKFLLYMDYVYWILIFDQNFVLIYFSLPIYSTILL